MQEDYSSLLPQELQKKFQEWFADTVPTDVPFPAEADYSNHKTRRKHADDLPSLLDLASFGCGGSILVGAIVGFILLTLNFSVFSWHINDWSDQIVVLSFAMALGFFGGLFIGIGSLYKLHERNFSKDEL